MFKKTTAAVMLTAAFSASAATSGPTFNLIEIQAPNGQKAFKAECHGVLESSSSCMAAARKACGDQPVNVLQTVDGLSTASNPHELIFSCGLPPQPAPVQPAPTVQAPAPVAPAPVTRKLTLDAKTNFAFDSAELMLNAKTILNTLISESGGATFSSVTVEGFTDSIGTASYNVALSERRAQAVLSYLKTHGLKSNNFALKGYGETKPVASNASSAGRAENRRVEINLTQ